MKTATILLAVACCLLVAPAASARHKPMTFRFAHGLAQKAAFERALAVSLNAPGVADSSTIVSVDRCRMTRRARRVRCGYHFEAVETWSGLPLYREVGRAIITRRRVRLIATPLVRQLSAGQPEPRPSGS